MMSCKTEAGAASEPGRTGQGRVVPPPRLALTSTGLGLRRATSWRAGTPSQARSASASAPWGCESSTMSRGVFCCEKPGSSWLLPPRSMQGARGCGARPGPHAARPPPSPAALPAAAILLRADWRARPARPARLPGRRGGAGGTGTGTGTRQEGTGTAPEWQRRRARNCAARSASPREPRTHKERRVFRPRSSPKGECSGLALTAGQGAAQVRTGCRVRPGECPDPLFIRGTQQLRARSTA